MAEHILGLTSDTQCLPNDFRYVGLPAKIDALSHRVSSILDTLAVVLVQESKEVIAVGVRIGPPSNIILSIANNRNVQQNTTDQVQQIWHRLNELGRGYGTDPEVEYIPTDVQRRQSRQRLAEKSTRFQALHLSVLVQEDYGALQEEFATIQKV